MRKKYSKINNLSVSKDLAHFVNNAQAIIFSYPLFKTKTGTESLFSEHLLRGIFVLQEILFYSIIYTAYISLLQYSQKDKSFLRSQNPYF